MKLLRYIIAAVIISVAGFLYFAWDADWFQKQFFADRFWPRQLDLVGYQIAHTEVLISYQRDTRTNDLSRIVDAYRGCLSELEKKHEAVKIEALKYLNNKNHPREWRQLVLEPKPNEYVFDEIEKIKRAIISYEEWLTDTLKSWDRGAWTNSQIDKKLSEFCQMVSGRQERLYELAAATYYLAERRR